MRQRIIVDKDQIDQLPQDLVDIKRGLAAYLNHHLDIAWDIYVYPFMNGDRPSFVLFNPFVGIQFIEIIRGRREDYTFEEVFSGDGLRYRKYFYRNVATFHLLGRVRTYRDKLVNLYIPQIREKLDLDPKVLAAFAVGIYFPEMSTRDAKELLNDEHSLAFGYDELKTNSIDNIVAGHNRRVGFAIQPEWVKAIEDWLNPQNQEKPYIQWSPHATHITSQQRIYPSWQEIALFRTPRTEGEITLAKHLDEKLPTGWEIFVEPFLNGDRPDFALLHPEHGLWIIEVKDWNPDNYVRRDDSVYVRDARGEHFLSRERRPEGQIQRYRENITRLVQSDFGGRLSAKTVRYGVYFHCMSARQAQALFIFDGETLVIGYDNLHSAISTAIMFDDYKVTLKPTQLNILRSWLLPPKHFLDQIHPISLDREQVRYAKTAARKHQVLQGVAGSGKSLILAQRAANLAEQGKRVLVVTFNITLWHYLRDLVSRTDNSFNRKLIEYNHFHGFCRDFLKENGIDWGNTDEDSNTLLDIIVPGLVLSAIKSGRNVKNRMYDAILVDEGQDYLLLWYETLCTFLSANNEVLIVSDPAQNVYQRNLEIKDAKFDRLKVMKRSYRLPGRVREQAERFAQAFFPDIYIRNEPIQMGFEDPLMIWRELDSLDSILPKLQSALSWLMAEKQVHVSDITILVSDHHEGRRVSDFFRSRQLQINHIFDNPKDSHSHKSTFEMGVGKLKVCTVHSFKGWELSNIVILTPTGDQAIQGGTWSHHLFYAAITRVKQNLIVFNRYEGYREYGSAWQQFE